MSAPAPELAARGRIGTVRTGPTRGPTRLSARGSGECCRWGMKRWSCIAASAALEPSCLPTGAARSMPGAPPWRSLIRVSNLGSNRVLEESPERKSSAARHFVVADQQPTLSWRYSRALASAARTLQNRSGGRSAPNLIGPAPARVLVRQRGAHSRISSIEPLGRHGRRCWGACRLWPDQRTTRNAYR